MNHTRLWVAATIIAVVVITSFVLSVPHTQDVGQVATMPSVIEVPIVTLRDAFSKGVHTITGSIEAPNACTSVIAESSLTGAASSTEGILVSISMLADNGICLQLPTRASFQTTISAPANVPITVTVNGAVATTTTS